MSDVNNFNACTEDVRRMRAAEQRVQPAANQRVWSAAGK